MVRSSSRFFRAALTLAVVVITPTLFAHAQTLTALYSFSGGAEGGYPDGGLVSDKAGNLFGTTKNFGVSSTGCNCGTVYELSLTASGWQQTTLYTFSGGTDGGGPVSNLILDAAGNLYGTTPAGGDLAACNGAGCGVVFRLSTSTTGAWTENVLFAFTDVNVGENPAGGLVFDAAGNLYGVTTYGGITGYRNTQGNGLVYELSPTSSGPWKQSILHPFGISRYDGVWPVSGLSIDAKGILYGTTYTTYGGVYQLTPARGGYWRYTNLRYFGSMPDGANPAAPPLSDNAGNVYLTTEFGGKDSLGAVVKLARGNSSTTESVIHSFLSQNDGEYPVSGLAFDAAGNLWGTAAYGGLTGDGAIFKLVPNSDGTWIESIISFDGTHGQQPHAGLILDAAGNLYGTTQQGGVHGYGVVFEITP